jgi:hypothetical protein
MILIFAHKWDESAQWLFTQLSAEYKDVLLLTDLNLIEATHWHHYLSSNNTETSFQLKEGRKIELANAHMIINRLQYVYPMHWAGSADKERNYAQQEYHAFFASWLHSYDGILYNPPSVSSLCGTNPEKSVWLSMAENSGFIIPENSFYINSDNNVANDIFFHHNGEIKITLVLDQEVVNAPPHCVDTCINLSSRANLPLLCIYFIKNKSGEWFFAGATPLPDFKLLPPGFLPVLHKKMQYAK